MAVNLEVGKRYTRRDHEVRQIVEKVNMGNNGLRFEDNVGDHYREDGSPFFSNEKPIVPIVKELDDKTSSVNLEVGKWYRRKDGVIRNIVQYEQTPNGYNFQDDKGDRYNQDGQRDCPGHSFDFLEEFEQKLEVGKYYRRYSGTIVRIVECQWRLMGGDSAGVFIDDYGATYTENGNRDLSSASAVLLEEVPVLPVEDDEELSKAEEPAHILSIPVFFLMAGTNNRIESRNAVRVKDGRVEFADGSWCWVSSCFLTEEQCRKHHGLPSKQQLEDAKRDVLERVQGFLAELKRNTRWEDTDVCQQRQDIEEQRQDIIEKVIRERGMYRG